MKLLEATALEVVADDGDARGVGARYLAEASDGEEHVLVRVERGVFGCRAGECACGWEKACRAGEAQIRLAFGCCGMRGGVAPGGWSCVRRTDTSVACVFIRIVTQRTR